MIFNKNLRLNWLLKNLFQEFEIEYITLNRSFLIICNKFQNLKIFYYLIFIDIKANYRLY